MLVRESHIIYETIPDKTRIYDYLPGKLEIITTRKGVKKALSKGRIRLNGKVASSGNYVHKGDKIELLESEVHPNKLFTLKINIHYEDDWMAIVEKPAGFPTSGNYYKTLHNCLAFNLKKSSQKDALTSPLPIHRLDSATGGLVIVAKTYDARIKLGKSLENKQITKHYKAIIQGYLNASGILNTPIGDKKALSTFKSISSIPCKKNGALTLMELSPITGRTHQLRIHLARAGHPIYGDKLHGDINNTKKNKGLFLFAYRLVLKHPIHDTLVDLAIDLPPKFARYISPTLP